MISLTLDFPTLKNKPPAPIMLRKGDATREKLPFDNVSLALVRAARNKHVPGRLLQRRGHRAPALPAAEPRAGGAFHQHGAPRPRRRLRCAGLDDAGGR